jgi:Kef-type K+ transport system membrane component KefB
VSGGGSHGKTPLGRVADLFGLFVVFAALWAGARFVPAHGSDAALIATLGFLLLAGVLLSELIEVVGLPHLSGYLAAGIIAGPHVGKLIDHETVNRLTPVNTLALCLIALSGGAELRIEQVKQGWRTLVSATIFQTLIVLVAVGATFYALSGFMSFTRDLAPMAVLGVSLLWGCLAIARSPSAALGILSQTHAQGPLARYTLAFIMTSDIVVVVILAGAITLARTLVDPTVPFTSEAFGELGHELLGSVALGTTLGIVLAVYLKLIHRQLLVVLIALGFGVTEMLRYLHYDALLTFMVAGFVVQNLSKQGEKLIHGVEQAGAVVYVMFFASAGAHLNVPLIRALWPVALALAASRVIFTVIAAKLSSRVANDEPVIRKYGWAPLVSQAGVALGVAQVAARAFPTFGRGFGDLAIACIAMNEICGPIIFKFALDRAKESRAPQPSLPEAHEEPA